ncbi:MAG TPA: DUF2889 domain-containing protein [Sedimenticola thiotaurini]|uniref:DUF2889 domain-containing protein n=1 Tax=Sedimenticola thiotaurini TaxID=1543721 RepID=A0A831RR49_9GAMM|nr:DUF2889 domain-containing protein [Sedimenticola thiotaurini]
MPLSKPVDRKHLHTRSITCKGFERSDGLWDIEAHLTDVKTYSFENRDRGGRIPAGEPVHGMHVRMTIDLDFTIHGMEAVTEYSPYRICSQAGGVMPRLVGLRIGPGWMRRVRGLIGGTTGCTHLLELLPVMATTAYQTLHFALEERESRKRDRPRPGIIDTCLALASDGPVVKREWPEFYTGDEDGGGE